MSLNISPRETLYLLNLNEKIAINKLKTTLQDIFSEYGNILQITAHSNLRMKGQAFITFESIDNAKNALKSLDKKLIFEKPVHILYSKSNSDLFYRQNLHSVNNNNNNNETNNENDSMEEEPVEITDRKKRKKELEQKRLDESKKLQANSKRGRELEPLFTTNNNDFNGNNLSKKQKLQDWKSLPPNSILLLQNIPEEFTQDQLTSYFENEKGFINLRYIKVRYLAFIEFDSESLATEALAKFENLITTDFNESTVITYAKK